MVDHSVVEIFRIAELIQVFACKRRSPSAPDFICFNPAKNIIHLQWLKQKSQTSWLEPLALQYGCLIDLLHLYSHE